MATPDADEMYGRRFGEPLIDGWPHISSLFNFSQGILCFAYCWLFLLGTINYMFPSLLLRDINTLRKRCCAFTVIFIASALWIPFNRFLHCWLTKYFMLPREASQLILPVTSLMISLFLYVDSLACIMKISFVHKCCFFGYQRLEKCCCSLVKLYRQCEEACKAVSESCQVAPERHTTGC